MHIPRLRILATYLKHEYAVAHPSFENSCQTSLKERDKEGKR